MASRQRPHRLPAAAGAAAAFLLATGGGGGLNPAHAEDECGTASASQTVVCDTGNYDSSEGNVFYQLPENTSKTDYSFELKSGLHISGTRGNAQVPADQETDDHSRRWRAAANLRSPASPGRRSRSTARRR